MPDLLLGVIGLGTRWERFRTATSNVSGVAITALHDPVSQRARNHALQLDCAAVEGFHALLRRPDVQAVLILGRTWYGPLPLVAACRNRVPVLLTEPPTVADVTREPVRMAVETCSQSVFVEFFYRRCPATRQLRRLIDGELGSVREIVVNLAPLVAAEEDNVCGHTNATAWIHAIDWCNLVVGESPEKIEVEAAPDQPPSATILSYTGGAIATIYRKHLIVPTAESPSQRSAAAKVACTHGTAYLFSPSKLVVFRDTEPRPIDSPPEGCPEVETIEAFKAAIRGGETELTPAATLLELLDRLRTIHGRWE